MQDRHYTANLSKGARSTFHNLLKLRNFYLRQGRMPEDGYMLLTNSFICGKWDIAPRTLERHIKMLAEKGFILTKRMGEQARRHVMVLEPKGATLKRQLEIPFPEQQAELSVAWTVKAPTWVVTGTDGIVYTNGETGHASPAKSAASGGTVAAAKAAQVAGLDLINDQNPLHVGSIPFHKRDGTDTPKIQREMADKKSWDSKDPVLDTNRAFLPGQTEDMAANETAHLVELWRMEGLASVPGFNIFGFKQEFRRLRAKYDRDKRKVVGEFYGFYAENLRLLYKIVEKCRERIEPGSDCTRLLSYFSTFLTEVANTQQTFTPLFVFEHFEELVGVVKEVKLDEKQKDDGIKRSKYPGLQRFEGVFERLDDFKATMDHYANLRRKANLNLNTEDWEWDERQTDNLLKFMEKLAAKYAGYFEKNGHKPELLGGIYSRLIRYWMTMPRYSPYYFAHNTDKAIEIAAKQKKAKTDGQTIAHQARAGT